MKITKNNVQDVFKSKVATTETLELKGYKFIKSYFVDSSGFGADDEPALTPSQFIKELEKDIEKIGSAYSFIIDQGQFQLYVGLFSRTGDKKSKIVGNNTLRIETEEGYIIRLYDTNIVEFRGNDIILNNGGFMTNTTKNRMNEFLTDGFVYQKNFDWFYQPNEGEAVKFEGETLTIKKKGN